MWGPGFDTKGTGVGGGSGGGGRGGGRAGQLNLCVETIYPSRV